MNLVSKVAFVFAATFCVQAAFAFDSSIAAANDPFFQCSTFQEVDTCSMIKQAQDVQTEIETKIVFLKDWHEGNFPHQATLDQFLHVAKILNLQISRAKKPMDITGPWLTAISLKKEFKKFVETNHL